MATSELQSSAVVEGNGVVVLPLPKLVHPHAELGVNTKKGSVPYLIDEVLLAHVEVPLTPKQISEYSTVGEKRVLTHLTYWKDGNGPGWTPKREKSGLHTRLVETEGKWFLKA